MSSDPESASAATPTPGTKTGSTPAAPHEPPASATWPGGAPDDLPTGTPAVGLPFPRRDRTPRRQAGLGIGARLGLVAAGLVLTLVGSSAVLWTQIARTGQAYDQVLAGDVRQALTARRMQVEFKKQVQEWKDILLRGFDRDDLATYTANFTRQRDLVDSLAAQLATTSASDAELGPLARQFQTAHRQLDASYAKSLRAFRRTGGRDFETSDRLVRGLDRPPTALVDRMVALLEARTDTAVARQKADTERRRQVLLAVVLCAVVVLVALLVLVVTGIVRPLRRLTRLAHRTAHQSLPAAIDEIRSLPADAAPPRLPPVPVTRRDELGALAEAITNLQDSAVDLAVAQRRTERETADMLVNLGRRNQNLLTRVLSYVTDLERTEHDPDVVEQLFRIDHATMRIRRNAASMLVLAGARPARVLQRPVPVGDVLRAALSEVEGYARVDLHHIEPAAVAAAVAADLVHLVAELVENATHYSPPHTRVTVVGQGIRDGYRVRVIDQGVGMTQGELETANRRIRAAAVDRSDARLLGLVVVGLLAERHGFGVELEASAGRGVTANVVVPARHLDDRRGDRRGDGGRPEPELAPAVPRVEVRPSAPPVPAQPIVADLFVPAAPAGRADETAHLDLAQLGLPHPDGAPVNGVHPDDAPVNGDHPDDAPVNGVHPDGVHPDGVRRNAYARDDVPRVDVRHPDDTPHTGDDVDRDDPHTPDAAHGDIDDADGPDDDRPDEHDTVDVRDHDGRQVEDDEYVVIDLTAAEQEAWPGWSSRTSPEQAAGQDGQAAPADDVTDAPIDAPIDLRAGVPAGTPGQAPHAIPTRVRGEQLARLGLLDDEPGAPASAELAPAPDSSSARLGAFQRQVNAARRALPGSQTTAARTATPAAGAPDDEDLT